MHLISTQLSNLTTIGFSNRVHIDALISVAETKRRVRG